MVDIDKSSPEWQACVLREKKKLYMVAAKRLALVAIAIMILMVPPACSVVLFGPWACTHPWVENTYTGIVADFCTVIFGTASEVLFIFGCCCLYSACNIIVDLFRKWLNRTAEEKCLERFAAKTSEGRAK